jgi:hypothetical protein
MLFIFILWERFASQRGVISRAHIPTSIEWTTADENLPLGFHNLNETGLITTP